MKYLPATYQETLIKWLIDHPRGAGFVGMGLGKTSATLEAMRRLMLEGGSKGALVVAPVRVCNLTWPHEVLKWDEFSWFKVANLRTEQGRALYESGKAHISLINYEALPKFAEKYLKGAKTLLGLSVEE